MASGQSQPSGSRFPLAEGDMIVVCPYDKSHEVLQHRYAKHVVGCRNQYREMLKKKGQELDMAICRWNFAHHFPAMEIKYHEDHCSHAKLAVDLVVKLNDPEGFKFNVVANSDVQYVSGEDWDKEVKSGKGPRGYDSQLKLRKESGSIIQSLPQNRPSTYSQHQKFREGEAAAFQEHGGVFNDDPQLEDKSPIPKKSEESLEKNKL